MSVDLPYSLTDGVVDAQDELLCMSTTREDVAYFLSSVSKRVSGRRSGWEHMFSDDVTSTLTQQKTATMFSELARAVRVSPMLDFTEAGRPSQEHVDFGRQLLLNGVFQLPYSPVLMRASVGGLRGDTWYLMDSDQGSLTIYFMPYVPGVGRRSVILPSVARIRPEHDGIQLFHIVRRSQGSPGQWDDEAHEVADEWEATYVAIGVGLLMMLMSPGVSVDTVKGGGKLHGFRKLTGKPVPDTYVVRVNLGSGNPRTEHRGGTHASPRPHWRRGHLRTYKTGLQVPVAPHIVGASGPVPELGKRMYEVVKSKLHQRSALDCKLSRRTPHGQDQV